MQEVSLQQQMFVDIGYKPVIIYKNHNSTIMKKYPILKSENEALDAMEKEEYFVDILQILEEGNCVNEFKKKNNISILEEPENNNIFYVLKNLIRQFW